MTQPCRLASLLGFAIVALAACSPALDAAPSASPSAIPAAAVMPTAVGSSTTAVLPAPTVLPATSTPVVGPGGQYATDPSTVDLASGRPTLVKFFAFW